MAEIKVGVSPESKAALAELRAALIDLADAYRDVAYAAHKAARLMEGLPFHIGRWQRFLRWLGAQ